MSLVRACVKSVCAADSGDNPRACILDLEDGVVSSSMQSKVMELAKKAQTRSDSVDSKFCDSSSATKKERCGEWVIDQTLQRHSQITRWRDK